MNGGFLSWIAEDLSHMLTLTFIEPLVRRRTVRHHALAGKNMMRARTHLQSCCTALLFDPVASSADMARNAVGHILIIPTRCCCNRLLYCGSMTTSDYCNILLVYVSIAPVVCSCACIILICFFYVFWLESNPVCLILAAS